jgi:hypothetical protein
MLYINGVKKQPSLVYSRRAFFISLKGNPVGRGLSPLAARKALLSILIICRSTYPSPGLRGASKAHNAPF